MKIELDTLEQGVIVAALTESIDDAKRAKLAHNYVNSLESVLLRFVTLEKN